MRSIKGAVPVGYIIAIILGVLVMGLLGYWLYTTGPKVETFMTESECKSRKMALCTEYTMKGKPEKIEVRMWVDENTLLPTACKLCADLNKDGRVTPYECTNDFRNKGYTGFAKEDLSVSRGDWWKCVAPGCEERYGITIRGPADC